VKDNYQGEVVFHKTFHRGLVWFSLATKVYVSPTKPSNEYLNCDEFTLSIHFLFLGSVCGLEQLRFLYFPISPLDAASNRSRKEYVPFLSLLKI
jgi:hypothetical protein